MPVSPCLVLVLLERPLDSPMTCQVTCNMSELILGHHGTIHFPAGQEVSLPRRPAHRPLPVAGGGLGTPQEALATGQIGAMGPEV